MKSLRTTAFGIGVILATLGQFLKYQFDGDPSTNMSLEMLISALAGTGLLFAKDDKS
jgi:hypothetical protein